MKHKQIYYHQYFNNNINMQQILMYNHLYKDQHIMLIYQLLLIHFILNINDQLLNMYHNQHIYNKLFLKFMIYSYNNSLYLNMHPHISKLKLLFLIRYVNLTLEHLLDMSLYKLVQHHYSIKLIILKNKHNHIIQNSHL